MLEEYRKWIKENDGGIGFVERSDGFDFETDFASGAINFVEYRGVMVVEMRVRDKIADEDKFYLHFELNDLDYAKVLFDQMKAFIEDLRVHRKHRILLACTGGLTTLYFADRLNESAQALSANFTFDATGVNYLLEKAFDYDAVLLAPQLKYMHDKVKVMLGKKAVIDIPPGIFATYDTGKLIRLLEDSHQEYILRNRETSYDPNHQAIKDFSNDKRILSLAVFPNQSEIRVAYKLYEKGKATVSETVIKGGRDLFRDVNDILDTFVFRNGTFDAVVISIPGITDGRYVDIPGDDAQKIDVSTPLERRYGMPVIFANNVNTAVLGYYVSQNEYEDIALISHPRGIFGGGAGIVIGGKMIRGCHNIAGEINYISKAWNKDFKPVKENPATVSETMDMVSKEAIEIMSVVDPELLLVRSEYIPYMDELKEELKKTVEEEYIPKLKHISEEEMVDYALLGGMILGLEKLDKEQ